MDNNVIAKISEKDFAKLSEEDRAMFTILKVEPDDYDLHKGDPYFESLSSQYRKASKNLRDYLYEKRNK